MKTLSRAVTAVVCIVVGLALMGAAHDKPQWYFVTVGIVGLLVFVGGPLYVLISRRAGRGSNHDA